jgi:hypothetical protein
MVDSEIITSLPGVTRRALLAGTATVPLAPILRHSPADGATADPIMALYQDWRKADAEALRWCRKWGELEAVLARSVGFPRVPISLPSEANIWVTTHGDIDRQLVDKPDMEALSAQLHAKLAALTARWEAGVEAVGLAEVERQEKLAWEKREALAFRAFSLPSRDLASIIIKLTVILRMGEARESDDEFPWPQIASVIADLERLAEPRRVG